MVSSRPIWLSQLCSLVLATLKSFPIIKPCPCPLILWSKEMTLQKPVEAKCRKRQQEAAAASFLLLSSIFSISDFIFDAWFYIWFWIYIWCLILYLILILYLMLDFIFDAWYESGSDEATFPHSAHGRWKVPTVSRTAFPLYPPSWYHHQLQQTTLRLFPELGSGILRSAVAAAAALSPNLPP